MRMLTILLLVLFAAAPLRAEEPTAEQRVFAEYVVPRTSWYVGEEIPVRLRFGYMPEFFEQRGVALFRQEVDVPVHVRAAFDLDVENTRSLVSVAGQLQDARDVVRFALDDDIVEGRRVGTEERDGRTYTVVEVQRRLLAERAGKGRLMAPLVRFAHATKFREDFLGGRTPLDRVDEDVTGRGFSLRILALPDAARPAAFADAVGSFTVSATHDLRESDPPLLHVTLEITGRGNLATLTPPPATVFEGFHPYAVQSEMVGDVRRIRYELAPLTDAVREIPAIPFAFLDPGPPATYRETSTSAMPLEGHIPVATEAPSRVDTDEVPPASPEAHGAPLLEWLWFVLVVTLLGLAWWWYRRGASEDAVEDGRHEALVSLRAGLADGAGDVQSRLETYLARALGTTEAAVIGPDLESRLRQRGLDVSLARSVAQHVEATVGARYGGAPAPRLERQTIDELERALTGSWR